MDRRRKIGASVATRTTKYREIRWVRYGFQTLRDTVLARGGRLVQAALGEKSPASDLLRTPVGRRRLLILVAAALVLAYAGGVLGYVMTTPEIGTRTAFTTVVNQFHREFLYPEAQEPLRQGDEILQVADRRIANWSQLLRSVLELDRDGHSSPDEVDPEKFAAHLVGTDRSPMPSFVRLNGQEIVRVLYNRDGEERAVWCRYARSPVETLLPSVLWFFLKIGLFAVGAVVYWKRPADRSAARFFLFSTLAFGAYMGGYHWARIVTQPVLLLVFMICAVLLPAVSLHFYLVFPQPKRMLERRPLTVLSLLYGPPLLFLVLFLNDYAVIRWLANHGAEVGPQLMSMLTVIYAYFCVAAVLYLASIICLVHSYWYAGDATQRNQVKWILVGELAALLPITYSLYLALFEAERFGGGGAVWPMFAASACVTVAFAVSITRYRLMELDKIISSGVRYFLISFLAACFYYGVVFLGMIVVGSQTGAGPSPGQALGVAGTAMVLMIALDQARGRVKKVLDHHFRREKHQLDRTWQRMSEAIEQLVDPPTLARRLLHTAADLLATPRGAVYLRQGSDPLYVLADALGETPALTELSSGCPLVEALRDGGSLAARLSGPIDPARRQLLFLRGEVAYALWHEEQLLGLLLLGSKYVGAYSPEDFHLLSAFSQLTVLALVSAEGRRSIETLNRELQGKVEKIAEQQRRILSLQSQLGARSAERRAQSAERAAQSAAAPNGASADAAKAETTAEQDAATDDEGRSALRAPRSALADGLVGSGPQVRQVLELVRKVAASESAVLLRGESGTGKELLARALHENSPRAGKPFVKVHCAALSPTLLESELFGHVKGAFTDAIRNRIGRFETAHGGTLFLDEIGDVSPDVQIKLLRVLQEKTFERVGSSEPVKVDVRIVAATHQDLERLIQKGRFRDDLFYRLNVLPIRVPPLRERVEDIPELAIHFLRLHARRGGKAVTSIDDDALALLKSYPWPGNIRQLENVIERAVVIADGPEVTPAELPPELHDAADDTPVVNETNGERDPYSEILTNTSADFRSELGRSEREHLVRALAAAGGNKAEAARALGIARSTLLSRLKRLGLS
jgi:transcriptional regulator with GAF, ATPase, and Fis domain